MYRLVVALSRDLGEEFYPHFQTFFETIIKIVIESKSTNIIEAGFKCYAYLTKYLRKQIIRDLQHHLKMFSCFLNPKLKTYVVIFACEAFSAVAGKFARDHPEKFLKLIFGTFLRKSPEVKYFSRTICTISLFLNNLNEPFHKKCQTFHDDRSYFINNSLFVCLFHSMLLELLLYYSRFLKA